ncbi:MAG TPA: molybdopterin-dependent oxidoreductase, partial [Dongiaceae bacterium]|nr:molybdopterin-dependent oxidoreductase [Dongiaceae bacterium]
EPAPLRPTAIAAPEPAPLRPTAIAAPRPGFLSERPPVVVERPRVGLAAQTRRDFLLWSLGVIAAATFGYWLLPERARRRLLPGLPHDRLDTLAARVGLTRERRERSLDRALTFDDDVAEALASPDRMVRTYSRADARPLRNNYDGRTPGPEYLPGWRLAVSGLASGRTESLGIDELVHRFPLGEQVTRLVCVEGWSTVAWWGGIRFADFLAAYPPAPDTRWASLVSAVNLDGAGRSDPYYVSIDLATARHPQTLLATRLAGAPLTLEHGAPLRLVAPVKLGLKNIKAITSITYTAHEPADYWNERGYSKYDGL